MFMAIQKLTDRKVKSAQSGTYEDGGGLRLVVSESGSRRWILRITVKARRREIGLGGYPATSLVQARTKAEELRQMVAQGIDPIAEKAKSKPKANSFNQCAHDFIETKSVAWSNAKHKQQWTNTLNTYASPVIGQKSTDEISIEDILKIITPIWEIKTETAKRVQSRIEAVIDYATARKYRSGDNPARWNHNLDSILPPPNKVKSLRHHPAMPHSEVKSFMAELRRNECMSSFALQFLILTASRSGEVLEAPWPEFNLVDRVWIIPAHRMKADKEHRVPLSTGAVEILQRLPQFSNNPFVFTSQRMGKHLSQGALLMLMRGMGHGVGGSKSDYVPHGFRSSFRDWAGELTDYPRDLCEMALAHTIANKVEAAYRRGDMLDKRKVMMEEWCNYISS